MLDNGGAVLETVTSDDNGNYTFTVNSNTNVRIRASARVVQTTGARWDVSVTDNTNSNALYTLAGSLTSSGAANSTRNLNAGSGWGGSSYTGTRAAGPFAILDPVYTGIQRIVAVDADVVFPPVEFRWSVNNRAVSGDRADGEIGTSSYVSNGVTGNVFILGDANNDTDEYDAHVVVHEWGHYFEDRLSRSDSMGGAWSGNSRLDPRIAFGEGFGNALSGIIMDDPFYRDSSGNQQANGFLINVENNANATQGWFSAASVQSILYDLYDADDDGVDVISLGIGPIYEALTADDYTGSALFISIFAFMNELRIQQPGSVANMDALLTGQMINGTGPNGAGETNNGGIASALPVYKILPLNGAAVEVCSLNDAGEFNRLGNRALVQLDLATAGTYTITMTRTSGDTGRDPDFLIWRNGSLVARAESSLAETETFTGTLSAGTHVLDAYDFHNLNSITTNAGDSCFDIVATD
ncbi:MAG: hypothetical protein JKY25_13615 [Robiginitomaculum sp.]|nr:hypothetical protein [Robiginitomaculum sp.]